MEAEADTGTLLNLPQVGGTKGTKKRLSKKVEPTLDGVVVINRRESHAVREVELYCFVFQTITNQWPRPFTEELETLTASCLLGGLK